MKPLTPFRSLGALLLLTGLSAATVSAADFSFDDGGGDNVWSNPDNWFNGGGDVPGPGDNIIAPQNNAALHLDAPSFTVEDWLFTGAIGWTALAQDGAAGTTLNINGTLSHTGTAEMLFRNSGGNNNPLTLNANEVVVNTTSTLRFGAAASTTSRISGLTIGSMDIQAGDVSMNVGLDGGVATVTGNLTMGANTELRIAEGPSSQPNRRVEIGSLNSIVDSSTIAANSFSGTETHGIVDLKTSGTASFAGRLTDTTGSNVPTGLGLEMSGTGTQILTGNNNDYTDGTTVISGTLLINNTAGSGTGTGDVDVDGGTFGGTGSATGNVTVADGAVLLGGNGLAASDGLALSGDVTFEDNSIISLSLGAGGTSSLLERLGGTWSFDDDQTFDFVDFGAEVGTYQDIIVGLTGAEAGLGTIGTWQVANPDWVGTFTLDGSTVDFTLSAIVPEPATGTLLLGAAGLLLLRRRK